MTGATPLNHENCFSLSLVEDPAKLWRGWERVGVRVSQSLCPLTSILSPGGERRYIRGYFLHNFSEGVKKLKESRVRLSFPPPTREGVKKFGIYPLTLPSPTRGEGKHIEIRKKFPPP